MAFAFTQTEPLLGEFTFRAELLQVNIDNLMQFTLSKLKWNWYLKSLCVDYDVSSDIVSNMNNDDLKTQGTKASAAVTSTLLFWNIRHQHLTFKLDNLFPGTTAHENIVPVDVIKCGTIDTVIAPWVEAGHGSSHRIVMNNFPMS